MTRQLPRLYSQGMLLLHRQTTSLTFRRVELSAERSVLQGLRTFSNKSDNIPVPTNVEELDASHKAQFSKQRSRDINGPAMQPSRGSFGPGFMSGSMESSQNATDAHVGSYDCTGAVSLHSVMQTNVPEPFSAPGKAPSHLNMPGGHWGQGDKYVAQDLQDAHATMTSQTSADLKKDNCNGDASPKQSNVTNPATTAPVVLSRKEKLKRAVKEYGATVIIFHVAISLLSLGGCYLAVSSGLDVVAALDKVGLGGHAAAAGASTFVVAYAVHKVFAPLRISITLAATPLIVRYLRRVGILKVPRSNNPKST